MHPILEDLKESSPITLVLLVSIGGGISYVVISMIMRSLRLLSQLTTSMGSQLTPVAETKPVRKPKNKTVLTASDLKPRKAAVPQREPGKSVKQLLKESKQAAASAHAHEKVPESEYFLNSLKGHGDAVQSVDIAPDNSRILTACADQVLRIYNMKGDFSEVKPALTRQPMKSHPVGAFFWGSANTTAACVASLTLGADIIVTSSKPSKAGSRDTQTTALQSIHNEHEAHHVAGAVTSGNGSPVMASMTRTKEIQIVSGNGRILGSVEPNGIESYQSILSPDGRFLAAATFGSDVKLWELPFARDGSFKGCQKAMELKGHKSGILSVAFNSGSTRVVTSSRDRTLRIWKIDVRYQQSEDPKCILCVTRESEPHSYSHLVWCSNGIIVGAFDGLHHSGLHYICSKTGAVVATVSEAHSKRITCLKATNGPVKCGALGAECAVVTSGKDYKARVWVVPSELAA